MDDEAPAAPPPSDELATFDGYAPRPPKDRGLALILEILPGLFGFLGFGWIYSGNTGVGILVLIGMLVWDFIALILIVFSVGLGCFCTIPVNLTLIAVSAFMLNAYTKEHPELFGT